MNLQTIKQYIHDDHCIGRGGGGNVYKINEHLACKVMSRHVSSAREKDITQYLQNKCGVQSKCGVTKVYDVFQDDSNYFVLMKLYNRVDWNTNDFDLLTFCKHVLSTLDTIHKNNIVHNDIKHNNILAERDTSDFVIIDFGSSLFVDEIESVRCKLQVTPHYTSYESIMSQPCTRSDIWSFGVILYKQLTGKFPFNGQTSNEVFREIIFSEPDFNLLKNTLHLNDQTTELYSYILQRMLCKDTSKRISAAEALMLL